MKEDYSRGFSITSNYESIKDKKVFSELLEVLMAYAHVLIGDSSLRFKKNKTELAFDFAMEAITKYLENPTKFDPTRNSNLVWYLKYHILRTLVSNFKKRKDQSNELLYENEDNNGIKVKNSFVEGNIPDENIDLNNLLELIFKNLAEKPDLEEVFRLRYISDSTRKEVIEELKISENEYNNRIRRLDTIRKKTLTSLQSKIEI